MISDLNQAYKTLRSVASAIPALCAALFVGLASNPAFGENERSNGVTPAADIKFRRVKMDECSDVDVRKNMSPKFAAQFNRIQNQGNSGICFALTASALWSYQADLNANKNVGGSQLFSGLYFWSQYSQGLTAVDKSWRWVSQLWGDNTVVMDGGMLRAALLEGQKYNFCPNDLVLSTLPEDVHGNERTARLAEYQLFKDAVANVRNENFDRLFTQSQFAEYFPSLSAQQVKEIVKAGATSDPSRYSNVAHSIFEVGKAACSGKMVDVKPLEMRTVTRFAQTDYLLDYINDQLSQPVPNMIGLLYASSITIGSGEANMAAKVAGAHVSPLIGRAFNYERGYCEYLVKDSFGSDTKQYITGLLEKAKSGGNSQMIRPNGDGTFWISDVDLFLGTSSISFLIQKNAVQSNFNPLTGGRQ